MDPHTQRAEAERWLGIAAKLMTARDFIGSKTFAVRAREADPNNPVSDQILAVIETILAGEKRVNATQQPDWYSILQLPRLVRDPDLIADHYRRLVMCLNPERNRFPFSEYALQLVMDAWSVLSDPTKKWLFDNELALFLQQQPQQPQQQSDADAVAAAAAAAGGSQLNTFQFFQQQPQQQQPQQQQQQQPMWQLQQPQQHQQQNQNQNQPQQQQQQQQQHQQQINQREFMLLPQTQTQTQTQTQSVSQQQQQQQQHQQVPPQWQMRDPTPIKGGERNKQVLNGIGVGVASTNVQTPTPMIPTQAAPTTTIMRPVPQAPPPAPPPVQHPQPPPQQPVMAARVTVAAVGNVVDGNAGNVSTIANASTNTNAAIDNNDVGNVNGAVVDNAVDEGNDEDVVEEVDCFWTACPYCFYIYEYQKVYQECTLRCQNCRKAFHAVQIPNPPPVSSSNGKEKEKEKGKGKGKEKEKEEKGKDKDKDKEKEKENSFCCWGFFPLGFSMTAWKKQQNQAGNMNGPSSWVPFSPMFASPAANGGGNFHWFGNGGGNAFVGPKHAVAKSTPRVYIDDDDEDFLELSESSDSSDDDWRTYNQNQEKTKGKKRRRRRGNVGGRRKGRPPKSEVVKQVNHNVASGGGVSVGGEEMGDGTTNAQEVVFSLAAGDRPNSSKSMPATLTRKQTRRSVKDVGRLDLNVEFNNDGEEHAPTVSAVNGEEDGIENIAFFDGLDEFLSTLPILNVGGDEKAKPS